MSAMSRARDAARLTPESRNRAADFYRTAAISFVVLGHWILVAPHMAPSGFELRSILAEQPWTQYLTWIFQVMPVFFFIGGYSNAASWSSARRDPLRRQMWAVGRMRRLLLPLVPFIGLWAVAAVIAHLIGVDPALIRSTSQAALIPVWFLAVYTMVTLVVPISYALWERMGLWSVALCAALAIAVDLIGVGLGQTWLRWSNYGPIWLGVHQLGYWWWQGGVTRRRAGLLIGTGALWMAVLIGVAGYPVSMVSVAGEPFSNTRPPTTAMMALGAMQIGLMLLAAGATRRWLQAETPWAVIILLARNIMTIYLWHLTVVVVLTGLSLALGGFGLRTAPGEGLWWALRPLWVVILALGLLPFIAIFGRAEHVSRLDRVPWGGVPRVAAGTILACVGLSMLALFGIGADGLLGLNWTAVIAVLAGVALAAGLGPGASSASGKS